MLCSNKMWGYLNAYTNIIKAKKKEKKINVTTKHEKSKNGIDDWLFDSEWEKAMKDPDFVNDAYKIFFPVGEATSIQKSVDKSALSSEIEGLSVCGKKRRSISR